MMSFARTRPILVTLFWVYDLWTHIASITDSVTVSIYLFGIMRRWAGI